ncbi:MAG TPA: hypothetical protein VLQ80_01705 [Candidatus Saccharimonadia bacterium]|nr:hypothetical protein [Candidatus Saccharimonadia bacterium]
MPWPARSHRTTGQGTVARAATAAVGIDHARISCPAAVPCCPDVDHAAPPADHTAGCSDARWEA